MPFYCCCLRNVLNLNTLTSQTMSFNKLCVYHVSTHFTPAEAIIFILKPHTQQHTIKSRDSRHWAGNLNVTVCQIRPNIFQKHFQNSVGVMPCWGKLFLVWPYSQYDMVGPKDFMTLPTTCLLGEKDSAHKGTNPLNILLCLKWLAKTLTTNILSNLFALSRSYFPVAGQLNMSIRE